MDPLKVFYLDHLRSICSRAKTPTSLVEGKSLDVHDHFVCHRLSEKGRLLWNQINRLLCYAWNLDKHTAKEDYIEYCSYIKEFREDSNIFHR